MLGRLVLAVVALQLTSGVQAIDDDQRVSVGIGILSKSSNVAERNLIRETWMQDTHVRQAKGQAKPHQTVDVRFFVGTSGDEAEREAVAREAEEHGDVVLVPCVEGYNFVGWQTLEVWRYFSGAEGYTAPPAPSSAALSGDAVQYVVKSDDDVFVQVVTLLAWLQEQHDAQWDKEDAEEDELPAVYAGHVTFDSEPSRNLGHWGLSKDEYPESKYPAWAGGPAYLLSRPLAGAIAAEHARLRGDWELGGPTDPTDAAVGLGKSGAVAADGKGLRVLRLEDISTALWVRHIKGRGRQGDPENANTAEAPTLKVVQLDERRFLRYRFCQEGAFTLLVEGGRQWDDRTDAFRRMHANNLAIRAGERRRTCAAGGTPQDYEFRAAVKGLAEAQVLRSGAAQSEAQLELATKQDEWDNFYLPFPEQHARAQEILFDRLELDVFNYIKKSARKRHEKLAAVVPLLQDMIEDLRAELSSAADDDSAGDAEASGEHFDL